MIKRFGKAIKKACKNFPETLGLFIIVVVGVTPLYLTYYSPYWLLVYSVLGAIIGCLSYDTIGKRVFGFCMGLIFCPLVILGFIIFIALWLLPIALIQYSWYWLLLYLVYIFIFCVWEAYE